MDVANADAQPRGGLVLDAGKRFVDVHRLDVRIDHVGGRTLLQEVRRGSGRNRAVRNRLGQSRVEVVGAADAGVGRQRAGREVVRHPAVEQSPVAVDLHPIMAGRIPGGADSRSKLVTEREVGQGAGQVLTLVAETGIDRHPRPDRPGVLREERQVVLRRIPHVARVGPHDAVDLAVGVVRKDARSPRRLTSGRRLAA